MPTVFSKLVSHENCVTFSGKRFDPNQPINLAEHIVQGELKLCFKNSSVDGDDNVRIKGFRDYHVDRYITKGSACKIPRCKEARVLVRDSKVKKIKKYRRNRLQTTVIGTKHGVYKVAVQFQPGVISNKLKSTRDIKKCQCSGCGKNVRCRHVAALLFSICDNSRFQQPLQRNKNTPYEETVDAYIVGDCVYHKDKLPESYPGPELAFAGSCKSIFEWSQHKEYGNNAAALTLMYAKGGCMNYYSPGKCSHPHCDHSLRFHEDTLSWRCNKYHDGCTGRHQRSISILDPSQSQYLSFLNTAQLGEFISFLVYYFNPNTAIEAGASYLD